MDLIRHCPSCGSDRSISELRCGGVLSSGAICGWRLSDIAPTPRKIIDEDISQPPSETLDASKETPHAEVQRLCENGHRVPVDEFMCLQCGADVVEQNSQTDAGSKVADVEQIAAEISGWRVIETLASTSEVKHCFKLEKIGDGETAVGFLVIHDEQFEPDADVYEVLSKTHRDHVPDILERGRIRGRAFEILEWIEGGSLAQSAYFTKDDEHSLRRLVDELSRALHELAGMGLRHRTISPRSVLIRDKDTLDLVITDFSSARLSDFDLDTVSPLEVGHYTAPEAIVGGVSTASDWWSLGMIVLEQVTAGSCFAGINERAFSIHLVTRGIEIPVAVGEPFRSLLRGLLARDPNQRWQFDQVHRWLNNEAVELPSESLANAGEKATRSFLIGASKFDDPSRLALGLADAENWAEGKHAFESGELATWLQENFPASALPAAVRHVMSLSAITGDWRFALGLLALNAALPLVYQGKLVTPAWLLENPQLGFDLITGEVPTYLETIEREPWLVRLHYRYKNVIEKARQLEIQLDDGRMRLTALATSRANLEAERQHLRELYPASQHDALASLMEKNRLNEEDLVILLCAQTHQFTPLAELMEQTRKLAKKYQQPFDDETALHRLLILPRRVCYDLLDKKIADFSRCNHATFDHWADEFRVQRRIQLPRAAILLSLPDAQWLVPPKQEYLSNILNFFEKRVTNSVMRGPLVRLTISKNSARIDLSELDSSLRPAASVLEQLLNRHDGPLSIDPKAFQENSGLPRRLWRLQQTAINNRRDTGIDSLYLGFPFVVIANEKNRPRVAPVFLWPVQMKFSLGINSALALSFDSTRSEIRLNPALESLLGKNALTKLQQIQKELLGRVKLSIAEVMDALGSVIPAQQNRLQAHPPTNLSISTDTVLAHGSAVLFNASFSGQAIAEDIRQLQNLSIANTALEQMLRARESQPTLAQDTLREQECYHVLAADPSQSKAVRHSRNQPGLVVEGPPGTGKSQTIVNIIADCLGRKEKVLVVCQKQAALRVVEKRLAAINLSHRLLAIADIGKDRQGIIRAIREQLPQVRDIDQQAFALIKQQRQSVSERIEALEAHFAERHKATHNLDPVSSSSYRDIICALIEIDAHPQRADLPELPGLRALLAQTSAHELAAIEDACASLAADWLPSNFETSALHCFKVFNIDSVGAADIRKKFEAFAEAEKSRGSALTKTSPQLQDHKLDTLNTWAEKYLDTFSSLDSETLQQCAEWFEIFYDEVNVRSEGQDLIEQLEKTQAELTKLNDAEHDERFFAAIVSLEADDLEGLYKQALSFLQPASGLRKYSPLRLWRKFRLRSFFKAQKVTLTSASVAAMAAAVQLEISMRPPRLQILRCLARLSDTSISANTASIKQLRRSIATLLESMHRTQRLCDIAKQSPLSVFAKEALRKGRTSAARDYVDLYKNAIEFAQIKNASRLALAMFEQFFEEDFSKARQHAILANEKPADEDRLIAEQLDTLVAYQKFRQRLRGTEKDSRVCEVFQVLRSIDIQLQSIHPRDLGSVIKQCIHRECLIAWKSRIEAQSPALLANQFELEADLQTLDVLDSEKIRLNKALLSQDIDPEVLGGQTQWRDITRLRGAHYKKLREFIDLGLDLGLMELRPVWLMSPEAVSQALPRLPGMFDVVIFDEASQMEVDYAVPALYRAKRVVVSGDEKQMPPSGFFSSSIAIDEDEALEELDEDASEAEIVHHEDAWNRREIKDCPDLLALGKTVLSTRTLEIHYRSKYRALIDFSNYAYYSGQLHIPALHPPQVIAQEKPVEVHAVNGVYTQQTNPDEAQALVSVLAQIWRRDAQQTPSIGVVTFNRKQAELIEDTIQALAQSDSEFYRAYLREQDREQDGEDMSFFVKNVENVQGDERDYILFSTTFGHNEHGVFRRNFGALGHKGGERRLNVAVTRARQKVIIVSSMPIREISDMLASSRAPNKPRDYLQGYLHYATKMSEGQLSVAKQSIQRLAKRDHTIAPKQSDNGFIQAVEDFLISLGHQPQRGSAEDAFDVDLALMDKNTGLFALGIECDAPLHPMLHNARARDLWRPRVLQRSIPVMHRINCLNWYQNPVEEKRSLQAKVEEALRR